MSRFIESVQLKNGQLVNLLLHEQRMQRTIEGHYGTKSSIDLEVVKAQAKKYASGIYKCRLVYTQKLVDFSIQRYQIRPINSLQIVNSQLDYSLKYEDRSELNQLFAQRGNCDDIIIAKDGYITDGSYTNLAFFDGQYWWTSSTPLLHGVQRQFLLDQGIICVKNILVTNIHSYQKVKLFNAMMDWENAPEVAIRHVRGKII